MPRRRPSALRAAHERPRRPAEITGLPRETCHLLDRLDQEHPRSRAIRDALAHWRAVSHAPRDELLRTFDDPEEQRPRWMSDARDALGAAVDALPGPHARRLAALVARADERILRRTRPDHHLPSDPDYAAPPHRGWWDRRTAV